MIPSTSVARRWSARSCSTKSSRGVDFWAHAPPLIPFGSVLRRCRLQVRGAARPCVDRGPPTSELGRKGRELAARPDLQGLRDAGCGGARRRAPVSTGGLRPADVVGKGSWWNKCRRQSYLMTIVADARAARSGTIVVDICSTTCRLTSGVEGSRARRVAAGGRKCSRHALRVGFLTSHAEWTRPATQNVLSATVPAPNCASGDSPSAKLCI